MSSLDAKIYETYRSSFGLVKPGSLAELLNPVRPYLEKLVSSHFPSDKNAVGVDLGCGSGLLVHVARTRGYARFKGIDGSPEAVDTGKALGIEGTERGDLVRHLSGLPAGSQDLLVTFDVLEHFDRDAAFDLATRVHAALKSGGRWLIHVPNGNGIFGRGVFHGDLTHKTLFTPDSLAQLVRAAGFSHVDAFGESPITHGPKSFLRAIGWRIVATVYLIARLMDPGASASRIVSSTFLAVATK